MSNLITELNKGMTLDDYLFYNEAIGMTVEVNDGNITSIDFEREA